MRWIEKYRPRNFSDCVGNKEIYAQLEGIILKGDIPHFLFYGPAGTGKTTAALIIAQEILKGDTTNLIEINASSDRGIDILRTTIKNAIRNMTFNGLPRIVFLDESDGITKEAQEMMRRPLEESRSVIFILALNEIGKMNMAILSRCATFHFKPVETKEIVKRLAYVAKNEGIEFPEEIFYRIAEKSGGDLRTAINELQKIAGSQYRDQEIERMIQEYSGGVQGAAVRSV